MSVAEKLVTVAENEQKVYDAGKETERLAWWRCITNNRSVWDSEHLFKYKDFSKVEGGFNPPFTLRPCYASYMFHCARGITKITKQHLDWVYHGANSGCFQNCYDLEEIEEIVTDANSAQIVGGCTKLHTIGKFILKDSSGISSDKPFYDCTSLKNITFEGIIPNSVSFIWCPLSKDSITSIVEHLSDEVTGQTLTLKASAVKTAFETEEGLADGNTSHEWLTLIATKPNWTISLK